jgi:hypothetical protein
VAVLARYIRFVAWVCFILWNAWATEADSDETYNRVVFEQPDLHGVEGTFHVPIAELSYPEDREFNVVLWQPNPLRADGQLEPATWSVGDKTGFYPNGAKAFTQRSFRDDFGKTAVQIDGRTIGAYLNSSDFPNGSDGYKLMIAPAYKPARKHQIYPFAEPRQAIENYMDLQVPVAKDSNRDGNFTYVTACFVFWDRKTETRISFSATLFHRAEGHVPPPTRKRMQETEVGPFDGPSKSFQIINPVYPGSPVMTVASASTLVQYAPWRGWRTFDFFITSANFTSALAALKHRAPNFAGSALASDYALIEWHLNAELTFSTGPAELGWSMHDAKLILVSEKSIQQRP